MNIDLCSNRRFRLKRWQFTIIKGEIPHITSEEDLLELATTWIRIFDHAFFFNLVRRGLDQQSPIKTYHDDSNGHRQGFSTPGYFIVKAYISLNSYVSHDDGTTGFVARSTISTLLYEMVHVFLALYSCQCTECQRHTVSRNGISGQSGHGPNWANAMNAIEEAFQDHVQWEVEGGMLESLALEMATSGWFPRDDQLERWGINPHELLSVAEEIELADLGRTGCQVIWLCNVMYESHVELWKMLKLSENSKFEY